MRASSFLIDHAEFNTKTFLRPNSNIWWLQGQILSECKWLHISMTWHAGAEAARQSKPREKMITPQTFNAASLSQVYLTEYFSLAFIIEEPEMGNWKTQCMTKLAAWPIWNEVGTTAPSVIQLRVYCRRWPGQWSLHPSAQKLPNSIQVWWNLEVVRHFELYLNVSGVSWNLHTRQLHVRFFKKI